MFCVCFRGFNGHLSAALKQYLLGCQEFNTLLINGFFYGNLYHRFVVLCYCQLYGIISGRYLFVIHDLVIIHLNILHGFFIFLHTLQSDLVIPNLSANDKDPLSAIFFQDFILFILNANLIHGNDNLAALIRFYIRFTRHAIDQVFPHKSQRCQQYIGALLDFRLLLRTQIQQCERTAACFFSAFPRNHQIAVRYFIGIFFQIRNNGFIILIF